MGDAFETTLSTTSLLLQKSSFKEVKAKHAAANKADAADHAAATSKTNKLHKGLVGQVVSDKSTKQAAGAKKANARAARSAARVEKHWAKKEAEFRKKARNLNKKQRAAARSMEGGVKSARKKLLADTARSLVAMHNAATKAASAKRLAKYKKEMAANAKAIAAGNAQ